MAKKKPVQILQVHIREMRPNKMFSEEQRQMVRGVIFNKSVMCGACGKKGRGMWTMLCQFKAINMESSTICVTKRYPASMPPLTPVCSRHPIAPDFSPQE